jgi:hypothetical protein
MGDGICFHWSAEGTYNVSLSFGSHQKKHRKLQYVSAHMDPGFESVTDVPSQLGLLSSRAKPTEKVRLRCMDANCPLRPESERAAASEEAADDPQIELQPDDLEALGVDELMEDAEDDEQMPALIEEEIIAAPTANKKQCVRDLWSFAFSTEHYVKLYEGFACKDAVEHFVLLTRSSHPSPMLAVHSLGKQAHACLVGQSNHARAHGQRLLREYIFNFHCQKLKAAVDINRKRVRSEDLNVVKIEARPCQSPRFDEVQADPLVSFWRAGIDRTFEGDAIELERAVVNLCDRELTDLRLAVRDQQGAKLLVTTRALKEGDVIGKASAMLYSTKGLMRDFLNQGGNAALMDAPLLEAAGVEVGEGLSEPGEAAPTKKVFGILVGAMRLLTDYRHAKLKFPNVELVCCPDAGPNDGFFELKVKTHNSCGLSAGAALVGEFGLGWCLLEPSLTETAKRLRGSLDVLWRKVAEPTDEPEAAVAHPPAAVAAAKAGTPTKQEQADFEQRRMQAKAEQQAETHPSAPAGLTLNSGECLLGTSDGVTTLLSSRDGKAVFNLFCPAEKTMSPQSKTSVKRKLPPKMVLCDFTTGSCQPADEVAEAALRWSFTKTTTPLILKEGGVQKYETLETIIKNHPAVNSVFQHSVFNPGQPPATLVPKKKCIFQASTEGAARFQKVLQAVELQSAVELLWEVEVKGPKIVPMGLALVVKKQVSLTRSGAHSQNELKNNQHV